MGELLKLVPNGLKRRLRERFKAETAMALEANEMLARIYTPATYRAEGSWLTWDRPLTARAGDALPLPPPEFRMGHAHDDVAYVEAGRTSAEFIRRIVSREGVALTPGNAILEWGCAGGRVIRHFAREAAESDVWGIDQHGPSIAWCKANLSPPFKFVTCTALPHLPFQDNTFTLVYAASVFTHILHLMDMWIMEFRRILRPGGLALFTVHDEHSARYLATHEGERRLVDPDGRAAFGSGLDHEVSFVSAGGRWDRVAGFLRSDWIARDWGQYLDVVSFEPLSQSYQTTVVLRKPPPTR